MVKLTIEGLTEKQYAIIGVAMASNERILTEHDFPAKEFKPLVRLGIFNEYCVYEKDWTLADATSMESLKALMNSPHTSEFKLTEYGNKVHHDHIYKWYAEHPEAKNITNLWDDAPIESAAFREPYKTPEQKALEEKLARWNKLAGG